MDIDLKSGKKIDVKDANFLIEVLGVFPKAQPYIANFNGEEIVNVSIGGIPQPLKRRVLNLIIESMIPTVEKVDENLEPENRKNKRGVTV